MSDCYEFDLVERLCEISSDSKDPWGVNRVHQVLASELRPLGFETHFYPNTMKKTGDLLHAIYNPGAELQIALVGHGDCVRVWEEGQKLQFQGPYLIGPGVADDKGGLTVAISGLRRFLKDQRPNMTIHFVSSPCEEIGSIGYHDFFNELGAKCRYIFGFEPAMEDGAPIATRFGNRWYKIKVIGEASHAGRIGRSDRNAAHELAAKITKLHELNQISEHVKLNVGSILGGQNKYNITCGMIEAKVDTRFDSVQDRDEMHSRIERILGAPQITDGKYVRCEWEIVDDCPPLKPTGLTENFLGGYMDHLNAHESAEYRLHISGGAADVNYLCHENAVTIDGLGPIGLKLHQGDEAVVASSLVSRSEVFEWLLRQL